MEKYKLLLIGKEINKLAHKNNILWNICERLSSLKWIYLEYTYNNLLKLNHYNEMHICGLPFSN